MKRLTAQRPILYGGRMYQAGDTLPAYDKRMVQAWLSAESAKMTDDAAEEATMPPQDADGGQDGTENADTTQGTQEVTDATEGTQESQENHDGNHSGESTDMVEGHLDPAQLAEMNKDDLKKLAKDMGVDLPRGAAKALIVERLRITAGVPSNGRPYVQGTDCGGHFHHIPELPGVRGHPHGQR